MKCPTLLAAALVLCASVSVHAIQLDTRAQTSAEWSCNNEDAARAHYLFSVAASDPEPAWFNALISWETTAYSSCDLSPFSEVFFTPGLFQVRNGNGTIGSQNASLMCPVQARNTTQALNLGGPWPLFDVDTSFCAQPCAPSICHGDNDCDLGL